MKTPRTRRCSSRPAPTHTLGQSPRFFPVRMLAPSLLPEDGSKEVILSAPSSTASGPTAEREERLGMSRQTAKGDGAFPGESSWPTEVRLTASSSRTPSRSLRDGPSEQRTSETNWMYALFTQMPRRDCRDGRNRPSQKEKGSRLNPASICQRMAPLSCSSVTRCPLSENSFPSHGTMG